MLYLLAISEYSVDTVCLPGALGGGLNQFPKGDCRTEGISSVIPTSLPLIFHNVSKPVTDSRLVTIARSQCQRIGQWLGQL